MKPNQDPGELFTVEKIAEKCEMSERQIRRLIKAGKLGHVKLGALVRVSAAQFNEWIRRSTIDASF